MKKIVATILLTSVILSATACTKERPADTTAATTKEAEATTEETTTTETERSADEETAEQTEESTQKKEREKYNHVIESGYETFNDYFRYHFINDYEFDEEYKLISKTTEFYTDTPKEDTKYTWNPEGPDTTEYFIKYYEYIYDDSDNLIKIEITDKLKDRETYYEFYYDKSGRIEEAEYNSDSVDFSRIGSYEFKYDESNRIISKQYKTRGSSDPRSEYKYDEQNNTVFEKNGGKITYYFENTDNTMNNFLFDPFYSLTTEKRLTMSCYNEPWQKLVSIDYHFYTYSDSHDYRREFEYDECDYLVKGTLYGDDILIGEVNYSYLYK